MCLQHSTAGWTICFSAMYQREPGTCKLKYVWENGSILPHILQCREMSDQIPTPVTLAAVIFWMDQIPGLKTLAVVVKFRNIATNQSPVFPALSLFNIIIQVFLFALVSEVIISSGNSSYFHWQFFRTVACKYGLYPRVLISQTSRLKLEPAARTLLQPNYT